YGFFVVRPLRNESPLLRRSGDTPLRLPVAPAAARMGKSTRRVRETATKGAEVIEALFTHTVADRVLLQRGRLVVRDGVPRRTGISLPAGRRALTIDAAVATAVKILIIGQAWRQCRSRRCGNGCCGRAR